MEQPTLAERVELMRQSINWHKDNRNISGKSADWEEGFIKGMEMSYYMMTAELQEAKKGEGNTNGTQIGK